MTPRLLALSLLVSGACASAPYVPEQPHPTTERIMELAAVRDSRISNAPRRFEVKLSTAFIFEGGNIRVTCFAPLDDRTVGRPFGFGVKGLSYSAREYLDRIENALLIERVPCGTYTASCTLATGETREVQFTARGQCNTDQSQ